MKIVIKNNRFVVFTFNKEKLIIALLTIFTTAVFPMEPERKKKKMVVMNAVSEQKQYRIRGNDSEDCVSVDGLLVQQCKTITTMIEDIGAELQPNELYFNQPIHFIRLGFDILGNKKKDIDQLSLKQLVNVANFFDYVDVPENKFRAVFALIKNNVVSSDVNIVCNTSLQKLNVDVQKLLMADASISWLKNCIIEKYVNSRKKPLEGHPDDVSSVAFSPDGKSIVSACYGAHNNLILWDISDKKTITHKSLEGHPNDVNSVAFSPDGKSIASGCYGVQNNLILWDISDKKTITYKVLEGHPWSIYSVAFSPDSKRVVSGGGGVRNNLILWDISDRKNITHELLEGYPNTVFSVAFSPDGKSIVSGGRGEEDNLILWDIRDINSITHKSLEGHPYNALSVAFSPDSKSIVSGCYGAHNNLILWDISDSKNITFKLLEGCPDSVYSVALSPDGKSIVSGCCGAQNNLILWDISDIKSITYKPLEGHPNSVLSVVLGPDGKSIVSGCYGAQNNLILWTLVTDQEELLLNQIKNNYTADQLRLLYQLYVRALKGRAMVDGDEERSIFTTLPDEMQQFLTDVTNVGVSKDGL